MSGLEELGHGREANRGPGTDRLGREPGRRRGHRAAEQLVERLTRVGRPVDGEQMLVLARDGSFEADHCVHPGRELGLDEKGGVGAVLAPAIGDPVIDDHDLAVIAQIDAPGECVQQRVADGQCPREVYPGLIHGPPVLRADQETGAQVVGHGPAGDAATRGALECLGHLQAIVVGQPDIEHQMDVIAGGVDVGHHGVDGGIRARHQFPAVAAYGLKRADRAADPKQMPVAIRDLGGRLRCICPGRVFQSRHLGDDPLCDPDVTPSEVDLAEQQIGQDAHHR